MSGRRLRAPSRPPHDLARTDPWVHPQVTADPGGVSVPPEQVTDRVDVRRERRLETATQGVAVYRSDPVQECAVARFDKHGALINADDAVGELVNTSGTGFFSGYYNNPAAAQQRTRHGMYWSGDVANRDADGWIYLAGRTADWMRVDGENIAAAPIERILLRLNEISRAAVYALPDENVGDQMMAAVVLTQGAALAPEAFENFLATQPDQSPKAWPRYVRIATDLPSTATHKVFKRELIAQGPTADGGTLWVREPRGTRYIPSGVQPR